jgi:hypothetical protein
MPKTSFTVPRDPAVAALDLVSYGRRGPTALRAFSSGQLQQIGRTVSGVPEVMVKVSGGGRDAAGVLAHVSYVGRHGDLELEMDDGRQLAGRRAAKELLEDWDLDLYTHRFRRRLTDDEKRRIPKLVHNVVLSMPKGTDSKKVLSAAQAFAREQFALRHRYAMVLHTDTPRPHVHLVVKAESEEGERLYIRKATLRQWREDFARHLRDQGVAANATARALRWKGGSHEPSRLRRAELRGASTVLRSRVREIVVDLSHGKRAVEPGKDTLERTRATVIADWKRTLGIVIAQGQRELAEKIGRFIQSMPAVQTEREVLVERLITRTRDSKEERLKGDLRID